jgi:hypothetical protein
LNLFLKPFNNFPVIQKLGGWPIVLWEQFGVVRSVCSQQVINLRQFQATELGHKPVCIEQESKVMLTRNKHNNVVSAIPSANKYSVIGKIFTLMQGIGRLYEDRVT